MNKSVGNLSLLEKVGQMFMVGIDGNVTDETIMELIQTYKIGGIMIYENGTRTAEQLLNLINSVKSMNAGNEIPLFVGIAHEGGRASVLPREIVKLPAIKYIAENSDKNLVYETAKLTGKILSSYGINMNFWPVLDLGGAVDGRNLSDRCISNNPVIVTSYGAQMVSGLNDAGVIAVPKYFPGHGTTKNKNSNIVIPYTNKSIQKLEQADLIPFRSMIDNGIDAMLVGHINVAKLNLFAPASMSYKVVTRLLREKYGFKGVTISDDLTTMSVDIQYGIKTSARKAILAGQDLMIIGDMKKAKLVLDDIAKQIRKGNLDPQAIDLRVQRILDLKEKFNLQDKEITELEVKKLNEEVQELVEKIRK